MDEIEQFSFVKEYKRDEYHPDQVERVNGRNAHQEPRYFLCDPRRIGGDDREIYDRSIYACALGDDDKPLASMVGMEGQSRISDREAVIEGREEPGDLFSDEVLGKYEKLRVTAGENIGKKPDGKKEDEKSYELSPES